MIWAIAVVFLVRVVAFVLFLIHTKKICICFLLFVLIVI